MILKRYLAKRSLPKQIAHKDEQKFLCMFTELHVPEDIATHFSGNSDRRVVF